MNPSVLAFKLIVDTMSEPMLIFCLGFPSFSLHPELYLHRLPSGLEYVSPPIAKNCIDYALGCKGQDEFEPHSLVRTDTWANCLVVYFYNNNVAHAALAIEGGSRFISQWGKGPVLKHNKWQIPQDYSDEIQAYLVPAVGNNYRR